MWGIRPIPFCLRSVLEVDCREAFQYWGPKTEAREPERKVRWRGWCDGIADLLVPTTLLERAFSILPGPVSWECESWVYKVLCRKGKSKRGKACWRIADGGIKATRRKRSQARSDLCQTISESSTCSEESALFIMISCVQFHRPKQGYHRLDLPHDSQISTSTQPLSASLSARVPYQPAFFHCLEPPAYHGTGHSPTTPSSPPAFIPIHSASYRVSFLDRQASASRQGQLEAHDDG